MADAQEEKAHPTCQPKREGWLMKRSKHFHAWKPRWTTLWEGEGSRDALDTTPELRGGTVSESFMLARMLAVRAVDGKHFGRPHCLVLDYFEGSEAQVKDATRDLPSSSNSLDDLSQLSVDSSQKQALKASRNLRGREIGLQAKDDAERDAWVEVLTRAWQAFHRRSAAEASLDRLRQQSPVFGCQDPPAEARQPSEADQAAGAAGLSSASSSAKGGKGGKAEDGVKGSALPPPPSGKGKGPGKAPPGKAPPGKGAGKGVGRSKEANSPGASTSPMGRSPPSPWKNIPRLPLGKRIGLKDAGEIISARDGTGSGEGRNTIFDNLFEEREQKVREDIEVLQNVFKSEPRRPAAQEERTQRPFVPKKKEERGVLTSSQAQNYAIVARTLPLQGVELAEAVESLIPGPLDMDNLDRLATALPGPDQMKQILAMPGPEETIRSVERQLLPVARIIRLEQHLRALSIGARLDFQQERFNAQMQVLQHACGQLRSSEILRVVLGAVLVMFNYVNFGNVRRNNARAFEIKSLLQLNGFKTIQGPFPAFTGLHFVALRLLAEKSDLTVDILNAELKQLHEASEVSLAAAQSVIDTLQSEAEFLRNERRNHPTAYGGQPRQKKVKQAPEEEGHNVSFSGSDVANSNPSTNPPTPNFGEACAPRREDALGNLDNAAVGFRAGSTTLNLFRTVRGWVRKQTGPEGNIKEGDKPHVPVAPPKGAPPGTWLMLGDPDAAAGLAGSMSKLSSSAASIWTKVWAEVKAPGIICYIPEDDLRKRSQAELRYAVFAGAEVVPFVSHLASYEGRESAEERPTGFELSNVVMQGSVHSSSTRSSRLWLDSDVPREALRWTWSLKALSEAPGVGFLWVHSNSIWRWRWVILHGVEDDESGTQARLLVWYRTPGEFLRGEPSIGGIRLGSKIEVCTFKQTRPNDALRTPFGFEVVTCEETSVLNAMGEKETPAAAPQAPRRKRGQVQAVTAEGASQKVKQARRGQIQGGSAPMQKAATSTTTYLAANSDQDLQRWVELLQSDRVGGLREELVIPEEGAAALVSRASAENIFAFIGEFGAAASSTAAETDDKATLSATSSLVTDSETAQSPSGRQAAVPKLKLPLAQVEVSFAGALKEEGSGEARASMPAARRGARVSFADTVDQEQPSSLQAAPPGEDLEVQLSARGEKTRRERRHSDPAGMMDASASVNKVRRQSTPGPMGGTNAIVNNVEESSCSDASSECSSDSDSDDAQKLPIQRLRYLMQRLQASARQLSSSLGVTTAECRQVLAYFGQSVHDATPTLLAKQVQEFLVTLDQFWAMLRTSFVEVQRHRQNCARKGLPDPVMMAKTAQQSLTSSFQFAQATPRTRASTGDFTPRNSATPKQRASQSSKQGPFRPAAQAPGTPSNVRISGEDAGLPVWKLKMQAKKTAKALISDAVRKSIVQLYARGAVELALWRALLFVEGFRHPILESEAAVLPPTDPRAPSQDAEETLVKPSTMSRPKRGSMPRRQPAGRSTVSLFDREESAKAALNFSPGQQESLPTPRGDAQPSPPRSSPRRPSTAQVQDLFSTDEEKLEPSEPEPDELLQSAPIAAPAMAEEEARLQAEVAATEKSGEEARSKAEEDVRLQREIEDKEREENEARLQIKEAELLQVDETARLKVEEEACAKAQEEIRQQAGSEARLQAKAATREQVEKEARLKAEKEVRLQCKTGANEEKEEDEALSQAKEAEQVQSDETFGPKAEEETHAKAKEEVGQQADAEARLQAQAPTTEKVNEEAALQAKEDVRQQHQFDAKEEAEEDARLQVEEAERLRAVEMARLKAEEEACANAQEEARQQAEAEARLHAEVAARKKGDEEARFKAEEDARLQHELEAKEKAEEDARLQAEEAERLRAAETARLKGEEEDSAKAQEKARQQAEAKARLQAELAAREKTDKEAHLKAEEYARLQHALEAKEKPEEDAHLQEEETERLLAAETARLKVEEEARAKAREEARQQAEAEVRLQAEVAARENGDEEACLKAEENRRQQHELEAEEKTEEDARLQAEEAERLRAAETARLKAEEAARAKVQEEARQQAEAESRLQAEAARENADEEARFRAEEDVRLQHEVEAKEKAEEDARLQAEEAQRLLAAETARLKAEKAALAKAEQEARQQAEVEARLQAEAAAREKADEEARFKAEENRRLQHEFEAKEEVGEEEAPLQAEETERLRAAEIIKLKVEEEARAKAQEKARQQAEAEARLRAEADAREMAEEEARMKAEKEKRVQREREAEQKEGNTTNLQAGEAEDVDAAMVARLVAYLKSAPDVSRAKKVVLHPGSKVTPALAQAAIRIVEGPQVRPKLGSRVRTTSSGRCGHIIIDDGSELPFKLQYSDGKMPYTDWVKEDAVQILEDLAENAASEAEAKGEDESRAIEEAEVAEGQPKKTPDEIAAQRIEDERIAAGRVEAVKKNLAEEQAIAQALAEKAAAEAEARREAEKRAAAEEVYRRVQEEQAIAQALAEKAAAEAEARREAEKRAAAEEVYRRVQEEQAIAQALAEKAAAEAEARRESEKRAAAEEAYRRVQEEQAIAQALAEKAAAEAEARREAERRAAAEEAYRRVAAELAARKAEDERVAAERAQTVRQRAAAEEAAKQALREEAAPKSARMEKTALAGVEGILGEDAVASPRWFASPRWTKPRSQGQTPRNQGLLLQKAVVQAVTQDQRVNRWTRRAQATPQATPRQPDELATQPDATWEESRTSSMQAMLLRHSSEPGFLVPHVMSPLISSASSADDSCSESDEEGQAIARQSQPTFLPGSSSGLGPKFPSVPTLFLRQLSSDGIEDALPLEASDTSQLPPLPTKFKGVLWEEKLQNTSDAHAASSRNSASHEPSTANAELDDEPINEPSKQSALLESLNSFDSHPLESPRGESSTLLESSNSIGETEEEQEEEEQDDEPINELTEVFGSDWTTERFSMVEDLATQHFSLDTPREPDMMFTPGLEPHLAMSSSARQHHEHSSLRPTRGQLLPQDRQWDDEQSVSAAPKPSGVRALLRKFESSASSSSGGASRRRETSPSFASVAANETPRVRALAAQFGSQAVIEDSPRKRAETSSFVHAVGLQDSSQTEAIAAERRQARTRTMPTNFSAAQGLAQAKDNTHHSEASRIENSAASQFDLCRQVWGDNRRHSIASDSSASNIFSDAINKLRSTEENKRTSLKNVFDSDWTNPSSALDHEQPFTSNPTKSNRPRRIWRQQSSSSNASEIKRDQQKPEALSFEMSRQASGDSSNEGEIEQDQQKPETLSFTMCQQASDTSNASEIKQDQQQPESSSIKLWQQAGDGSNASEKSGQTGSHLGRALQNVTTSENQADADSQMRAKMAMRRSRFESNVPQNSFEEAPSIKSEVGLARPRSGGIVRVKDSGRRGRIILDDGSDLPFKVEFGDGGHPATDWFRVDAVDALDEESKE